MIDALGDKSTQTIPPVARALNNADAAMVWLLTWSGKDKLEIAAHLRTMPSKVAGILSEQTHVGSRDNASRMYPRSKDG